MKSVLILLLLFLVLACNDRQNQGNKLKDTSYIKSSGETKSNYVNRYSDVKKTSLEKNLTQYFIKTDSLIIPTEIGDTLRFSKQEINEIINDHPEFFENLTKHPDLTYHKNGNSIDFSSEVGQDSYFALYAYFLKLRNGSKKYVQQRSKLISIFSNINSLYSNFQHGGTYFGHQSIRILAYAEYAIYVMPKTDEIVDKTYNIDKQKAQYISSLRQLIEDENKIDFDTKENQKPARLKKLNKLVDELNKLITDLFYLRQAQKFQYTNYEYY